MAQFNVVIFPFVMRLFLDELILEDRRISAKSIAEKLDISHERVGSNIHEDLDMRKLSAKWVPKCLNEDHKCQWCQ